MRKYTPPVGIASLFDGKVCTVCTKWHPYSDFYFRAAMADKHSSFCRFCRSAKHQKCLRDNPDAIRAQRQAAYEKIKSDPVKIEHRRKSFVQWEEKNKQYRNRYKVELNHRRLQDPVIAEQRRQKQKRDEEAKEQRRLQRRNPQVRELEIACVRRRAERLKANGGSYTKSERDTLFAQYGNKCLRCGRSDVPLTADHVVPVLQGGSNLITNIQPLCQSCNSIKGTSTIDYRIQM